MANFEELIMRNTRANQPAAGRAGRLYFVTDEGIIERDNGTSWDFYGTAKLLADLVLKTLFDANTILAANADNTPAALTVDEATIVGRQTDGEISAIGQVSAGEKTAGTETLLRAFSPDDVKDMIDTHGGAAVRKVGYGPTLTPPVLADFSWVNQGTATSAEDSDGIYLNKSADSSINIRALVKSAPSTPYTITALFVSNFMTVNYHACGLLLRQSSNGKLITFGPYVNSTLRLTAYKYTSPTTYSASYVDETFSFSTPLFKPFIWFRIADDGVNRVLSHSIDGVNFVQDHSITRTDFLTADQVGFFVNPQSASYPINVKLLHWSEG